MLDPAYNRSDSLFLELSVSLPSPIQSGLHSLATPDSSQPLPHSANPALPGHPSPPLYITTINIDVANYIQPIQISPPSSWVDSSAQGKHGELWTALIRLRGINLEAPESWSPGDLRVCATRRLARDIQQMHLEPLRAIHRWQRQSRD
ncbi:hypothetical protein BDZ89DRAFT_692720 [Hymenopellis radicata]|nr:hypothetical protein BDZ89DRAFT_692720 [Hymenopellis radicata]